MLVLSYFKSFFKQHDTLKRIYMCSRVTNETVKQLLD